MVQLPVLCPACQQPEAVHRPGKATDDTRRYRRTACRPTFQLHYQQKIHLPGVRADSTDLALNGSGIRDTARVLGISPQAVRGALQKKLKP